MSSTGHDPHIEQLNEGAPTTPRQAASVILLRAGGKHDSDGLELLLGKRTPAARFMAGVWVFPGGAVDGEAIDEPAHRAAALRELDEEVGITLDGPDQLIAFSRWITPVEVKIRFDTRFYLAEAPPHCSPEPDGQEIVDVAWISPARALEQHAAGELSLVFPTIKQLESLSRFATAQEAIADAAAQEVEPILPKVAVVEGEPRVLLPGDDGYDEV
ncbi:MAG: NUDIX hydrolase [Solirubrobacterales bacterium]